MSGLRDQGGARRKVVEATRAGESRQKPETRGFLRWIRCGDPTCRCAKKGGALHGPYRYKSKRIGNTVQSVYLGKASRV